MIDFLARERHFFDHLLPIWRALPVGERGMMYIPKRLIPYAAAREQSCACGYETPSHLHGLLSARTGLIVSAAYGDLRRGHATGRPQVLCEHGAGQSYSNRHTSYAGGGGDRSHVVLYLCPNEFAAARNRRYHPHVPAVVIGSPKLDRWHIQPPKPRDTPPVVAISFHWDCTGVCPETRSAWEHYRRVIPDLLGKGWKILGHGHPRILERLAPVYRSHGIEVVWNFEEVMARADCYVCDNSSTLFEFASLDRPVVVMNAPWYRKHVRHGLRFWECADVGVQVDHPAMLSVAIARALEDEPAQHQRRQAILRRVYPVHDGTAGSRAATALLTMRRSAVPDNIDALYREGLLMNINMIAHRSFYLRGKLVGKGSVFSCDAHEAERLETTLDNGRPWAERIEPTPMVPVPAPVPAPLPPPVVTPEPEAVSPAVVEEPAACIEPVTADPVTPDESASGVTIGYVCGQCGRRFDTPQGRMAHMRVHKGEEGAGAGPHRPGGGV